MMSAKDVRKKLVELQLEKCNAGIQEFISSNSFKKGLANTFRVKIGNTPLLDETRKTLEDLGWKIKRVYQSSFEYYIVLSAI